MVPYPSIAHKDGKVWEKGKDGGQDTVIAPRIQVLEVCIDRETREHWMLVGFEALDGSAQLRLNRGDLNRRGLLVYQKYGFPVTETNATKIIYHLLNEEIRAPRVYIHRSLGWAEHDAELVFHHHIAYGLRLPSRYEGELAIQPGGTAEGWIQAIRAYVLGRSPLELALCCGLSACVVGLIGILVGLSILSHACVWRLKHGKDDGSHARRLSLRPSRPAGQGIACELEFHRQCLTVPFGRQPWGSGRVRRIFHRPVPRFYRFDLPAGERYGQRPP